MTWDEDGEGRKYVHTTGRTTATSDRSARRSQGVAVLERVDDLRYCDTAWERDDYYLPCVVMLITRMGLKVWLMIDE